MAMEFTLLPHCLREPTTSPSHRKASRNFEAKGVVLEVAQKARLDVTLTVGAVTEEVLVSGEKRSLKWIPNPPKSAAPSPTNKSTELELNGRNFTQLVALVPGVVSQTGQDEGTVGIAGNTMYSINGAAGNNNNWKSTAATTWTTAPTTASTSTRTSKAIAEFKVLTSNYGAQLGKNGSGTIETEIRGGTTSSTASAFYYGRNDFLQRQFLAG